MIKAVGYRLVVKTKKYEDHDPVVASAKKAGLQLAFDNNTRYDASVDEGVLVAAGPDAWDKYSKPWAEVGDLVAFAKNSGKEVKDPEDPDTRYIIINDEDVVSVILNRENT